MLISLVIIESENTISKCINMVYNIFIDKMIEDDYVNSLQ